MCAPSAHFPLNSSARALNHWSRSNPRFQLLVDAGGKHILRAQKNGNRKWSGKHILFNYFNIINNYHYLHNLVVKLQYE